MSLTAYLLCYLSSRSQSCRPLFTSLAQCNLVVPLATNLLCNLLCALPPDDLLVTFCVPRAAEASASPERKAAPAAGLACVQGSSLQGMLAMLLASVAQHGPLTYADFTTVRCSLLCSAGAMSCLCLAVFHVDERMQSLSGHCRQRACGTDCAALEGPLEEPLLKQSASCSSRPAAP